MAALLLAGAGHAGLGFMVLGSGAPDNVQDNQEELANILTVSLNIAELMRGVDRAPIVTAKRVDRRERAQVEAALVAIAQPNGPHYFRMNELTQKPSVVQDAVADLIIRMPGLEPQPVVLRLLISDEGSVDHVLVEDSFLSDDVEFEIRQVFSKLRFEPGRIGRIAVRSQMRVEVRLETMARRLPG